MTRRTMAERKRRGADRTARRESLLVLLSRTRRGVTLTDAEAALLFAHVEVELAEADELRRTVQGQQTAIQVMGNRAEAADAVIVEVEKDRDQVRAELAELQAAAKQAQQRARVERSAPDAEHAAMNRHLDGMRTRAEQAEEHLAAYVDIFGPDAPDDFHTMQHRAKQAEATLDRVRALARRMRAGSPQGAAAIYADRIEQTLGSLGPALTDEQAAVHAAFAEAADSTEARLAEQQRAHEIQLATVRRALSDTETLGHRILQRAEQAEERLAGVERRANIAEGELATLREGIRETGGDPTQVQNVYAQIRMWRNSAQRANHKADRYRLAWTAARRDRKADRAAMAAELPFVKAGRAALDRAGRDRAALLAALTR
jgi:chromosome segregation ATPase